MTLAQVEKLNRVLPKYAPKLRCKPETTATIGEEDVPLSYQCDNAMQYFLLIVMQKEGICTM